MKNKNLLKKLTLSKVESQRMCLWYPLEVIRIWRLLPEVILHFRVSIVILWKESLTDYIEWK